MIQNFTLSEDSKNSIGINNSGERTFNKQTFKMLNQKRKNLDKQFGSLIKEKNDLLSYYSFKPIKFQINTNSRFKTSKNDLDDLFTISEDKRLHKEIYKTKLYNLISPYYLVAEKKYIKYTDISPRIRNNFINEKETLRARESSLSSNKHYDKDNQTLFELPSNNHIFNKITNEKMLNEAVKEHCLVVKIKNNDDGFDKILLLKPDFTIKELQALISFIYKACYNQNNIGKINLFYYNQLYNDVNIEDNNLTLGDLCKEMKNDLEIEIFIQTQY
jgi:hypothetical protein